MLDICKFACNFESLQYPLNKTTKQQFTIFPLRVHVTFYDTPGSMDLFWAKLAAGTWQSGHWMSIPICKACASLERNTTFVPWHTMRHFYLEWFHIYIYTQLYIYTIIYIVMCAVIYVHIHVFTLIPIKIGIRVLLWDRHFPWQPSWLPPMVLPHKVVLSGCALNECWLLWLAIWERVVCCSGHQSWQIWMI